jgi:hypothetical protein
MPVQHVDPKILELERQILFLKEQVIRLSRQVEYLDRERVRSKNDIGQIVQEVRSRR